MAVDNVERFLSRIDRSGGPDACHPWQGRLSPQGYGTYAERLPGPGRKVRQHRAHRVIFELEVGPIPDGLVLDHLCRRRECCNPAHLEAVTQGENVRRAPWANATACPEGHVYTEADRNPDGSRRCLSCHAARERLRRATVGG